MAEVSPTFTANWRSRNHVGGARLRQIVKIQPGLIDRKYQSFTFLDGSEEDFGQIAGSTHNDEPWQGFWRPTGAWREVPNVRQVDLEQGFSDKGIQTATITIDNVIFQAVAGGGGVIHKIVRGFLSPWRGFTNFGRPATGQQTNDWFGLLNGGCRIRILQGLGNDLVPVFAGLIDDTDVESSPDTITVTARDFGVLFTDQRVFGSNKAPEVRSPITFADRQKADNTTKISSGAAASSQKPGNPALNVTKPGSDTYWLSTGHSITDFTEWVQIRLPKGRYETMYLYPHYEGHEIYVSVYAHSRGLTGKCKVNGEEIEDGWVDIGAGSVPGVNGGHPCLRKIPYLDRKGRVLPIGASVQVGDNSILRISVRNLKHSPSQGDFRAGIARLVAYKRVQQAAVKASHWILVDDAADVLKWVFMWAGFHEWEVESFGARLKEPMVFHQSSYLMDIVDHMAEQGDYSFYMGQPSADENSIGVPIFRHTRAIVPSGSERVEVRDSDLLTDMKVKFSKEPLPYIIRVRGKESKSGSALGEDTTKRIGATYFPPWSGAHHSVITGKYDVNYPFQGRLSGVVKHITHTDFSLETEDECMMMAILIALQAALSSSTAIIEIPGHPGIELDDQVSVIDDATGVNTRLWVASKSSSFVQGENSSWTTTLGGSMIDTPDMLAIALDLFGMQAKVLLGE